MESSGESITYHFLTAESYSRYIRDALPNTLCNYEHPKLCSICVAIYPELKNRLASPDSHGRPCKIATYSRQHMKIHAAYQWKCSLCELVCKVLYQVGDHPTGGFSLWIVDLLNAHERGRSIDYNEGKYVNGILVRPNMLPVYGSQTPLEREVADMENPDKAYRHDGLIMAVNNHLDFGVKVIDAQTFDISAVKTWMSECDSAHSECQQKDGSKEMLALRVIDVQHKEIIRHDMSQPYVALSYVWGPLAEADAEKSFPDNCPRVVLDAISAVRRLGYRYLWVDRHCIDQNSEADKMMQVAQMDLIYENAALTIVAAAGNDDRYGLPGVGRESDIQAMRSQQPIAQVGQLTLASSLPGISHHIEKCRWATRGWTYQEALLSRRCLIFTEEQFFFVCRTVCRSETLADFPLLNRDENARNLNLQTIFQPDGWSQGSTLRLGRPVVHSFDDDLRHHAKMYATRNLTRDSDALNALTGILKRARTRSYYGVPILTIAPETTVRPFGGYFAIQSEFITIGFLFGLLWHVLDSEDAERRDCIPSWTWLSVKNSPVDFRYIDISHLPQPVKQTVSNVQIWVGEQNSSVPLSVWVGQHPGALIPSQGSSLLIEGQTIPITTIYYESQELYARFETDSESVIIGVLRIDYDALVPGAILNDKWLAGKRRDCDLGTLSWVALLLADTRGYVPNGALEYLVVQKDATCYTRLGTMRTETPIQAHTIRQEQLRLS